MSDASHLQNVDWPALVGSELPLPRTLASTGGGTLAVLSAADELAGHHDVDVVIRRAVELCRERLGLERAAVFLYDESGEKLCGTWGTDLSRHTTDEHHLYFQEGFHHRQAKAQALGGDSRWLTFERVPLTVQVDGQTRIAGYGWASISPILGRSDVVGLLCNDAAISHTPVDDGKQAQAAIFGRLLGGAIEDLRRGSRNLPWQSALARLPRVGQDDRQSLVVSVVHALHEDPTLSAGELSKRFALSESKLARVFKAEMTMSLGEYRNHLRIERFFTLVAPGGGNLLQAALDAGFGSYAQFHRVFRRLLGSTPKDYLSRHGS